MQHIVGVNYTTNQSGVRNTTLHLEEDFDSYYSNAENGRGCSGKKVSTVYVGSYDCSGLKVGMDIDVLYDKAITTSKGTFQAIKRIDVLGK